MRKEFKIEYNGLICHCNHEIIWDKSEDDKDELKHINIQAYGPTIIIIISKDCKCGCMKPYD